jgi:adenosine deaminase
VRAVEDPDLIERLRAERTPLELCPTSNLCLGLAPSLARHPFDRLRRAGLELSVNTDDPVLFDTTLSRELLRLADAFGYDAAQLAELVLAGVRHSFLPPAEKQELERAMRAEIAAAANRHLGQPLAL